MAWRLALGAIWRRESDSATVRLVFSIPIVWELEKKLAKVRERGLMDDMERWGRFLGGVTKGE